MRLDQTRIAIRERGLAEVLDLALKTWRRLFFPLLWTSLPAIVPLSVLNAWLLHQIVDLERTWATAARYAWDMSQLIAVQAPLATSLTTLYLGRAVFDERVTWRQILGEVGAWTAPLVLIQLTSRGIVVSVVAAMAIDPFVEFSTAEVYLMLITAYALIIRGSRPYITEVIALERNPLRESPGAISVSKRIRSLRMSGAGEASVRIVVGILVAAAMLYAGWSTLWFLQGTFFNAWIPGWFLVHIGLPACMWLIAIYQTVVRFMSYLDLRIRSEGWEVELQLRAAAAGLHRRPVLESAPS